MTLLFIEQFLPDILMVEDAPSLDVFKALLEHQERLWVIQDFQRFQNCLHQVNIHDGEYLLIVPSDPN